MSEPFKGNGGFRLSFIRSPRLTESCRHDAGTVTLALRLCQRRLGPVSIC